MSIATRFENGVNLTGKELLNAILQNLSSHPTGVSDGYIYYNTTDDTAYIRVGGAWQDVFSGVSTHDLGGGSHNADTLANLNSKVSDATLDDSSDARPPEGHAASHTDGTDDIQDATSAQKGLMTAVFAGLLEDATSANTADAIVQRDASGNFRASTPQNDNDVAIKSYVDAGTAGLDPKESVRMATDANISDLSSVDVSDPDGTGQGVTLAEGDRVLVKDQTTASENGIYVVGTVDTGTAPLSRSGDADSDDEVSAGMFMFVAEGAHSEEGWVLGTNDPITVGTTDLTFTIFSAPGGISPGDGLSKSGDTLSIDSTWGGQSAIDTVGTITTGTWEGDDVAVAHGGTGASTAAAARSNLGATGKYAVTIGDGASTSFTVNHALGTSDVTVAIRYAAGDQSQVFAHWEVTDTNNVTVKFAEAPDTDEFRVIVTG